MDIEMSGLLNNPIDSFQKVSFTSQSGKRI